MSFLTESIYNEALQIVNFRMDEANKRDYNLFGKDSWYLKYFNWSNTPRTQKEFDTLVGLNSYDIAASTYNSNSANPVRAIDGFGKIRQSMFTHGHTYKLDADDLRDIALYSKMFSNEPAKVLDYIVGKLYNVRERAINGIHTRLDVIILTALSNGGSYTFSSTNDPNSPYNGTTITFGTPSIGTVTTPWTDANTSVDPIKDISDVVTDMDVEPAKILMSRDILMYLCKNSAVKTQINGTNNASKIVTPKVLNEYLTECGLPVIELINRKCRIQNGDSTSKITPFDGNKILFVPEGNFGTIESTFSDKELGLVSPGVEYANSGRIEVSSWKKGEKEGTNYTEYTKAEVTAAPSIDRISDMYQLTVRTA